MKVTYRDHTIDVSYHWTLGGQTLPFICIIRVCDQDVIEDAVYEGSETVEELIALMKKRVDAEIEQAKQDNMTKLEAYDG